METTGQIEKALNITDLADTDLSRLDLFVYGDPYAVWRRLRAADPVHWNVHTGRGGADEGFWSVTGYDDAVAVYRDPQCYSSERGVALTFDLSQAEEAEREMGYGRMLIITDPPRHARMRHAFNRLFAPRALAVHEPLIRALTREIVDAVAAQGRCDFVGDVAARLPTAVLCELMRIPAVDRELMFMVANQSIGYQDEEYQQGHDGTSASRLAQMAFFSYFMNLLAKRRARPGEDLLSALIAGETESGPPDDMTILFNCFLLIIVGQETTRNAISSGLLALLEAPQHWRRLCAERTAGPAVIEEILRFTTPVTHIMRTARRDCELRGRPIRAGQRLALWNASANRDETAFAAPDELDLDRAPNEHLAFGYGEHHCLGAHLARLELKIMFEELLERLPDLALAAPVSRVRSNLVAGIKHMPVRFTPAPIRA
jgi:cytochrome P450